MPEKLKFDKKSLKKERVLGSSTWYTHSWGEGEQGKEKGNEGFSKSNHSNFALRIKGTKGKRKSKHLENSQLLQKQNFLLQTLTN